MRYGVGEQTSLEGLQVSMNNQPYIYFILAIIQALDLLLRYPNRVPMPVLLDALDICGHSKETTQGQYAWTLIYEAT
jgi:hypothetical protein